MDKIATNKVEKDLIDLDNPLKKNISNLADFMNKDISSITACIMDRPRHKKIINELKELKVKIKLITDGDVLGALYVSDPKYNIDIFLGIGGGPEGVLAASALDAFDCHFQGRFIFNNDKDIQEAKQMGITDLNKKYELNEIIKGDSIFCATGITSSDVLSGIEINDNNYTSETFVTHKDSQFKKIVKRSNHIKE
jgi:fructose-1,6-bisphosphatase II / sedoheptulose-1,7-bisphosphatase